MSHVGPYLGTTSGLLWEARGKRKTVTGECIMFCQVEVRWWSMGWCTGWSGFPAVARGWGGLGGS